MRLDEIEALTRDAIKALPIERLEEFRRQVSFVDLPQEPTPKEMEEVGAVVVQTYQSLETALLGRSNRICGGMPEPYVETRWHGSSPLPW